MTEYEYSKIKKALEFYAHIDSYEFTFGHDDMGTPVCSSKVVDDAGALAREALQALPAIPPNDIL